jgi:toxin ParE1/3/4
MKPVSVRPRADQDIDDYAAHIAQDNLDAALRFIDAVQVGFDQISAHPSMGAPRYAHLIDGLRFWPIPDFPNHLIFYFEQPSYVDVIRVLHGAMDLPTILQE